MFKEPSRGLLQSVSTQNLLTCEKAGTGCCVFHRVSAMPVMVGVRCQDRLSRDPASWIELWLARVAAWAVGLQVLRPNSRHPLHGAGRSIRGDRRLRDTNFRHPLESPDFCRTRPVP